MNPHLHHAMIVARTTPSPAPRHLPPRQPTLLYDAAPLLAILMGIAGLAAFGATSVI
jgi:hypothetical protein